MNLNIEKQSRGQFICSQLYLFSLSVKWKWTMGQFFIYKSQHLLGLPKSGPHTVMLTEEDSRFLPNWDWPAPHHASPPSSPSVSIILLSPALDQPSPAPPSKWTPPASAKRPSPLGSLTAPNDRNCTASSNGSTFHLLFSSLVSVSEKRDLCISAPSLPSSLPHLPSHIRGLFLGFCGTQSSS